MQYNTLVNSSTVSAGVEMMRLGVCIKGSYRNDKNKGEEIIITFLYCICRKATMHCGLMREILNASDQRHKFWLPGFRVSPDALHGTW